MEQIISDLLQNKILSVLVISLVSLFVIWLLIMIIQKFFSDEITWLLQKTIFSSLFTFKIIVTLFLFSLVWLCVYLTKSNFLYGLIPTIVLSYLLYRIFILRNRQSEALMREFKLQKYSTSLKYLKSKDFNSKYRRKVYWSIINKIELIDLNSKNVSNEFLLAFSKIYTFDNFNRDIESLESKQTIKQLFYEKYKLSLLSTIDDYRKINDDYKLLGKILSSHYLLIFDGNSGLHYNKHLIHEFITKESEKSTINTPIKFERKTLNVNFSQKELKNSIVNVFIQNNIEITESLFIAIQDFIYKNFKNKQGKNGTFIGNGKDILIQYIPTLKKALMNEKEKINCNQKEISEIISLYFDSVKESKTIENI